MAKKQMRLLVCGGRDFADFPKLVYTLNMVAGPRTPIIIHGAARGADTLADQWAKNRGFDRLPFPADWDTYGDLAGPVRNTKMLNEAKPNFCVAFPGSRGTADMVTKCRAAGVPVYEVPV